jgi:hypothetical protein
LQRLPPHRIQRAYELSEIGLEEDPATTGLGSRDEATLRPPTDLFRVHVEKRGGFVEIEGFHAPKCPERAFTPGGHDRAEKREKSAEVCAEFRQKPSSGPTAARKSGVCAENG